MAYLEIFQRVADHVRRQGVSVKYDRGDPVSWSAIERARSEVLIPIPPAMAEFYAEVGDGLVFAWSEEGDFFPPAFYEFPQLADCAPTSLDQVKWRTEWDDDYDFAGTDDPMLARQTALKMRRWMPIYWDVTGDRFCLDNALDPAPVVFDRHDWFDGGTGENGHVLAPSLLDFFTDWARLCFQHPRFWSSVFKPGGGVNWNSEQFREPFRLTPGT